MLLAPSSGVDRAGGSTSRTSHHTLCAERGGPRLHHGASTASRLLSSSVRGAGLRQLLGLDHGHRHAEQWAAPPAVTRGAPGQQLVHAGLPRLSCLQAKRPGAQQAAAKGMHAGNFLPTARSVEVHVLLLADIDRCCLPFLWGKRRCVGVRAWQLRRRRALPRSAGQRGGSWGRRALQSPAHCGAGAAGRGRSPRQRWPPAAAAPQWPAWPRWARPALLGGGGGGGGR